MALSGLKHMMGAHQQLIVSEGIDNDVSRSAYTARPQILFQGDTFYREFEIPLLEKLDDYRAAVTVSIFILSDFAAC